jgi:hypothetical protein
MKKLLNQLNIITNIRLNISDVLDCPCAITYGEYGSQDEHRKIIEAETFKQVFDKIDILYTQYKSFVFLKTKKNGNYFHFYKEFAYSCDYAQNFYIDDLIEMKIFIIDPLCYDSCFEVLNLIEFKNNINNLKLYLYKLLTNVDEKYQNEIFYLISKLVYLSKIINFSI